MSRKLTLIFTFAFSTWLAYMSKTDVGWKRERKLDDVIKGKGYPNTEVVGVSVLHCVSLYGLNSSCSSFFFLPTTGRCLLYEEVFQTPDGGPTSSGARYFTADDHLLTSRFYLGATREGVLADSRRTWDNTLHPLYWLNGVQVALSEPDSDWSTGNPDNERAMEGCMEIVIGKCNDLPCGISNSFICEKELN